MREKKSVKIMRFLIAIMMITSTMIGLALISGPASAALGPGDVVASVDQPTKQGRPMDIVSFKITYTNKDDNEDAFLDNFTVSPKFPPSDKDWNATISIGSSRLYVPDSNGQGIATLNVRVGSTAKLSTSKLFTIKCDVEDFDGNVEEKGLSLTATVLVSQNWELSIKNKTGDPDTKKPGSNNAVKFNMTVTNSGNGQDSITLSAAGSPGDVYFTPSTPVEGFSQANYTMNIVNIPEDVAGKNHVVTVTVTSENASVKAYYGFVVAVAPYYELEMQLNDTTTIKDIQPGSDVIFKFKVLNKGNIKDNLKIESGIVGKPPFWTTNVNPISGVTIKKDSHQDITMTITAPTNDSYPHIVSVYIKVSSQNKPTVFQNSTVQVKLVQQRSVDIVVPSSKNVNSTRKVSFPISVYNKGNGQDTFEFSITGTFPTGEIWTYEFSPNSITLNSKYKTKNSGTVYLNFSAPEDAKYGSFQLTVNSFSSSNPSIMDSDTITIVVGKLYSIALYRLVNEKQAAYPGDNVSIKFQGENTGNFADSFYLSMNGPPSTAGWAFNFQPGLFANLPPDETQVGYLNVSVDSDAKQGYYVFTVKAASATDPTKSSQFTVNLTVKKKYKVDISAQSTTESTSPGDAANFRFTVRNRGTGACNVTMDKVMTPEIAGYMNIKITPKTFFLSTPTDDQVVWVNMTPSSSNPLAPMNITSGVPITVTADINERDGGPENTEKVYVKINQTFDVQIWPDALEKTVKPGKIVNFTLEIRNTGNGKDSYSIITSSVLPTWSAVLSTTNTQTLNKDGKETVKLSIQVPINEKLDYDNITINVTSRNAQAEGLVVYSIQDIRINIRSPVAGLNMSMTDGTRNKNTDPGKTVVFNVTVTNTGVDVDRFTFEVDYTNKDYVSTWTMSATQSPNLAPEEDFNLQITFTLRSDAASDFVNITLKGTSKANVNTIENFLMTIRINPIFDIDLTYGFTGNPNQGEDAMPGQNATFNIRIENEGTSTDLVELEIEENYADISAVLSEETFYLGASLVRTVLMTVILPDEPNEVENIVIKVKATSKKDDANPPAGDTVDVTFNIDPPRDVDISSTDNNLELSPNLEGTKASIDYALTVTNKGRDRDSFKIAVAVDSAYASWFTHVAETPKIDEDATTTVTITVELPNGEMPKTVSFDVTATSVANTVKSDSEGFTLKILESYGLNLIAVDSQNKVELDDEEVKEIGNDRVVEFNLEVINIGTGPDDYKIELVENTYLSWVTISPADILNLDEGLSQGVVVTVKVPKNTPIGDIKLTIKATSRGDDTNYDTSDASENIELWITVTQIYDVYIPDPTTQIEGKSGQLVQFKFTLKNRGNGVDSVLLGLKDKGDWPWTISPSAPTLQPQDSDGDSRDITLSVVIPTDAEVMAAGYTVNLTVTSDTPEGDVVHIARGDLTFRVDIEQKYNVKMTVTKAKEDADPGDTVNFRINLRNDGNGPDTYDISSTLEKSRDGILPAFDMTLSRTLVKLPPFTNTYIWLNVSIPDLDDVKDLEDITADTYKISVHAESNEGEIKYTLNLNVTINEEYLLQVEGDTNAPQNNPIEVDADDPDGASFFLTVTNLGNYEDDIEMDVSNEPTGWKYEFKIDKVLKDSFSLDPGESMKVEVIVTFDEDAEGTTDFLDVLAQSEGNRKNYRMPSADRAYIKVMVYSLAIESIELSDDPEVDTTVTITANIRNSGEGDAEDVTVKFKIGTTQKSVTVDKIEAGTTAKVNYDWKVTEGEHKIEVEVDQFDGTSITQDKTVTASKPLLDQSYFFIIIGILIVALIILLIWGAARGRSSRELPPEIKAELAKLRKESEMRKGRAELEREDVGSDMLGAGGAAGASALPSAGKFKELPPASLDEEELPAKEVKIKCPKCDKIQIVPSAKRPLEFGCEDCGQKLVLKKK